MATPDISCDLCGGTDFYCEEGFYYCSECQRQTQDIQEHVFEEPEKATNVQKAKKVTKKKKVEKQDDRITSWECYNYILLGLVNELTELGASENLKSTIETLWFKYLKGLQVVGNNNVPPKLQAYNSGIDAEIIYGRKAVKQKRRRSRSTSPSTNTDISTLDAASLKQARRKQKTALAKSEYQEIVNTTQQSEASLHNQSLGSLKGSSEPTSKDAGKFLQYHRTASRELQRKMTNNHFREHCRDVNSVLSCHKPSSRGVSRTYVESAFVLSRSKLFSILYLGLLINKEDIQLGDMLRYIREGHLSYEYCNHFFPEEFIEKHLNVCTFSHGNQPLLSAGVRKYSAKMAEFLGVKKYIPVQNLVQLCGRYCKELNLPDEFCDFVVNLLSRCEPKMTIYDSPKLIPNYEARAMSLIIFVLKLLFCLDDMTELEYSKLAEAINENFENDRAAFNFERWLKHIEYRKLILAEHHFPTTYLKDDYSKPDNFIGFLAKVKEKNEVDDDFPLEIQLIQNVLESIKNSYPDYSPGKFSFCHSLTPFRDYLNQILTSDSMNDKNYCIDLLNLDCSSMSLDFLNSIEAYMKSLLPNEKLTDKHGGKNDNIKIIKLFDKETERFKTMRSIKKVVNVTFVKKDERTDIANHDIPPLKKFKEDSEGLLRSFENENLKIYKQNRLKRSKSKKNIRRLATAVTESKNIHIDNTIYNASERVWLNLQNITDFKIDESQTFLNNLPTSFRLILKECARIIEQTEKDLFLEYCMVEGYLSYGFNVKTGKSYEGKVVNTELVRLLKKARKNW